MLEGRFRPSGPSGSRIGAPAHPCIAYPPLPSQTCAEPTAKGYNYSYSGPLPLAGFDVITQAFVTFFRRFVGKIGNWVLPLNPGVTTRFSWQAVLGLENRDIDIHRASNRLTKNGEQPTAVDQSHR